VKKLKTKTKQARKQRKYLATAPLHIKQKLVHAHLSKELREKHNKRSLGLKKGDKVKIMRGQFKKISGNVEKIDLKKGKAIVTGIEMTKKDGSKVNYPLNVSNLMITELNLEDKKRKNILERKQNE
jgi:large subunit ribosomal protein L24